MRVSFRDKRLEDLYRLPVKESGKQGIPVGVLKHYQIKIQILEKASDLRTIAQLRGLNLEKLKSKEYEGCYSIRVNKKYRIIFTEVSTGEISLLILELSNHYH